MRDEKKLSRAEAEKVTARACLMGACLIDAGGL